MTGRTGLDVLPVGLVVKGRRCLVVGGGQVAARKIAGLLACGASVTVVAPELHEAVASLVREGALEDIDEHPLDLQLRPYRSGEAAAYCLVFTATGDRLIDGQVAADADAANVWVNSADDPAHCSAVLPAVHRDGVVSVAVSTGGSSPALASWLRDRVAGALGPGLGALADLDWRELLDGPLPGLVAEGKLAEARELLVHAIDILLQ